MASKLHKYRDDEERERKKVTKPATLIRHKFCLYCNKSELEEGVEIRDCIDCGLCIYCSDICERDHEHGADDHAADCMMLTFFDSIMAGSVRDGHLDEEDLEGDIKCNGTNHDQKCFHLSPDGRVRDMIERDLLLAKYRWAKIVESIAYRYSAGILMKMYATIMEELMLTTTLFKVNGISHEMVYTYLNLREYEKADNLYRKALKEAEEDDKCDEDYLLMLLISGVVLGFYIMERIKKDQDSFDTFISILQQSPFGSSANRLSHTYLAIDKIARLVFDGAYLFWKRDDYEEHLQKTLYLIYLYDDSYGILQHLDYPHLFKMSERIPQHIRTQLALAHKIIHRFTLAPVYLERFITQRSNLRYTHRNPKRSRKRKYSEI